MTEFDCAIVGAGIHGLCTAAALIRAGARSLCVLDQFAPGHDAGSSHGSSRITRRCYAEPDLVQLAEETNTRCWPTLERQLGERLLLPTPGVFFGPADGPIAAWIAATKDHPAAECITPAAAARRFPLLRFAAEDAVLVDHTAAVVLAAVAMQALRRWLAANGVELRWHCRVLAIDDDGAGVQLATSGGPLRARRAVVAAGPWAEALLPNRERNVVVIPQQVGYFALDTAPATLRPGQAPVWCRIGRNANDFIYGLPDVDGRGVKAAQHRTAGAGVDPDGRHDAFDDDALLDLARDRFAPNVLALRHREYCLYTMAPGQRLAVARLPQRPAVVRIAACSGHAFKFGPLLGERAAQLALT
jgi:glycine/D-amino acid oxidase-like deaminating enzyme